MTAVKKKAKGKKAYPKFLPAALLCALSLAVMAAALLIPGKTQVQFTPPPFDPAAEAGSPQVPEGLGWQMLDAQAYSVGICGKLIPRGNSADLWLTNPEGNTVWLKVRVLDAQGNILGETGLIRPGEYVQSVQLDSVPPVGSPVTLKIMAYQPETYYSEGAVPFNTSVYGQ